MAASSTCQIIPGVPALHADYLAFAREAFGAEAYQSNPDYLHWLYEAAPLARADFRDFHLARNERGRVIGCIHMQRMLWRWQGESRVVATPHNTMVRPEERKSGAGGLLSAQAVFGEAHVLVPGTHAEWAAGLRRMGYADLPTEWRARWLRPVAAAWREVSRRLGSLPGRRIGWATQAVDEGGHDHDLYWRCRLPMAAIELADVVNFANQRWLSPDVFSQEWTNDLFFWRFFHPRGPRHRLITFGRDGALGGYLVLSLGLRHGLGVARAVEWSVKDGRDLHGLLSVAAEIARRAGAHLMLVMGGESQHDRNLAASGWRTWRRAPHTLFYHRNRALRSARHAFMASAGDYGFEAFGAAGTV